jgi:hypothetical protein
MAAPTIPTRCVIESKGAAANAHAVPAHVQLIQMATGCWISQLVSTAANLCIADHLAGGPKSASEIAEVVRCNPRALHSFIRALANFGIVPSAGEEKFTHTPLGEALKSGAPGAGRSTVLRTADGWCGSALNSFSTRLRPARRSWKRLLVRRCSTIWRSTPSWRASSAKRWLASIAESLRPSLLRTIFRRWKSSLMLVAPLEICWRISLLDIRNAAASYLIVLMLWPAPLLCCVPKEWKAAFALNTGISSRACQAEAMPTSSHIIHDWSEEQCLTILSNCRKAMRPGSKLLIVEFVLPEGDEPHIGKLLDMTMLAVTRGEERTATEYKTLLARAGLTMTRVIPTGSEVSIVEAELLNP